MARTIGIAQSSSLLALLITSAAVAASAQTLAFPEAEGFGRFAEGGRGGRVIKVTNLNDSGPGSFRAAVLASGPRIVIFDVGGTIELQSRIDVDEGYLTIAGQTAPGGGITIKGDEVKFHGSHTIVRYLRFRLGSIEDDVQVLEVSPNRGGPAVHDVIIDHCSVSWGADEMLSIYGGDATAPRRSNNVTVQWSIVSEGLRTRDEDEGGKGINPKRTYDLSLHHNLFAHNHQRNPKGSQSGLMEVINNVIYNQGWSGAQLKGTEIAPSQTNIIGNVQKNGRDSRDDFYIKVQQDPVEVFVDGNLTPARPALNSDELTGVIREEDHGYSVPNRIVSSTPDASGTIAIDDAQTAYERVLAEAGASFPVRDAVDARVVAEVRSCELDEADRSNCAGTHPYLEDLTPASWPTLARGVPPVDSDDDGLPDPWEFANLGGSLAHGAAGDFDGDGYDNIENYVNGLVSHDAPGPRTLAAPVLLD